MTANMPPELAAAVAANPVSQRQDKLDKLRSTVAQVRDLEATKTDLEGRLKEVSDRLLKFYRTELPEMMDEAGVPAITLEAEGNMPSVEAKAQPYYSANIAASWPPEKRQTAFKYLEDNGHGDLIKTEVSVFFPRDKRDQVRAFLKRIAKMNPEVKESVHNQTLTAWLKEQIEDHHQMPDLEKIGGHVGRVVTVKVKKP